MLVLSQNPVPYTIPLELWDYLLEPFVGLAGPSLDASHWMPGRGGASIWGLLIGCALGWYPELLGSLRVEPQLSGEGSETGVTMADNGLHWHF